MASEHVQKRPLSDGKFARRTKRAGAKGRTSAGRRVEKEATRIVRLPDGTKARIRERRLSDGTVVRLVIVNETKRKRGK